MGDAKIIPISSARRAGAVPAPRTVDEALGIHLDTLFATARFLCRDVAASEDLVQETALAAFHGWGELRDPAAARGWLLCILRRQFLNSRRHDSRRPPVHDVDLDIDLDIVLDDPNLAYSDPLTDSLERDQVIDAVRALPPGFAEVVWLSDALELAISEIAVALEIPIGTAASRLYRARRMLRERLGRLREDSP